MTYTGFSRAKCRQMQGKVANMQNAFKGSAVQKKGNNWFAIAACTVALLSTAGLVAMFVATDDSTVEQGVDLTKEVEDLKANEEFYLGLKKRLEAENEALAGEKEELAQAKEEVDEYVAKLMSSEQSLRDDVRGLERKLADARDDIVRAGTLAKVKESTTTKKEGGEKQFCRIMARCSFPAGGRDTRRSASIWARSALPGGAPKSGSCQPLRPLWVMLTLTTVMIPEARSIWYCQVSPTVAP